jgi:hypothetical protein
MVDRLVEDACADWEGRDDLVDAAPALPASVVAGTVQFVDCAEQEGNSCGPHALNNVLDALGIASPINLAETDKTTTWIQRGLTAAAGIDAKVHRHAYLLPSIMVVAPSDNSWYPMGVDVLVAMMISIDADIFLADRDIYVITPTDAGGAAYTHFISFKLR